MVKMADIGYRYNPSPQVEKCVRFATEYDGCRVIAVYGV